MSDEIIKMENISKSFFVGKPNEFEVLHSLDLTVNRGEFVAIVGESGSGKSTLMNIIGLLDRANTGSFFLDDVDISTADDKELSKLRNQKIGFVFQTFNLISRQNAIKNVELPMLYNKIPKKERNQRAKKLLELVGMNDRMTHKPSELSGGQKQRVAIARAMANDPSIILADEPTGALDSTTSRVIMDIFHTLNSQGKTIVLITHNNALAGECDRIVRLSDGSFTNGKEHKIYDN